MSDGPAILLLVIVGAALVVAGLASLGMLARSIAQHRVYADIDRAAIYVFARFYARVVHRLQVVGQEHLNALRDRPTDRPVIVVANHTAGVDPVLISVCFPTHLRWMMALDMRAPALTWFWDLFDVIFVDRDDRRGGGGIREAMRELKNNGVLGIFPEGALERPPRRLLRFQPGVGMLIAKSNAIVIPIIIEGTPQYDPAWASLWHTSRSSLRVLPWWEPPAGMIDPAAIAKALQDLFAKETGWDVVPEDEAIEMNPSKGRVAA